MQARVGGALGFLGSVKRTVWACPGCDTPAGDGGCSEATRTSGLLGFHRLRAALLARNPLKIPPRVGQGGQVSLDVQCLLMSRQPQACG